MALDDLINGYSGHYPPGQVDFEVAMQPFPDAATIEMLRARGATHVSVNCALYGGGCDALLQKLDASPDFRPVSTGRWQSQVVKLFELNAR